MTSSTLTAEQAYRSFLDDQVKRVPSLRSVVDRLLKTKGEKVLIFCHDDPDGVTAGAILCRLLKRLGAEPKAVMSPLYEYEPQELDRQLSSFPATLLIVTDKGTLGDYDKYCERIKDVIVLDHHPPQGGKLSKALWYNPAAESYVASSASTINHMVATLAGVADDYDVFLALVGMKADWSCEPATDFVAPFCKPLFDLAVEKFPNLFQKVPTSDSVRATMFEVQQRERTTLLNQIAELYFALTGGGFQYFYNDRHMSLRDINQPALSLETMLVQADSRPELKEWETLEQYLSELPNNAELTRIWNFFLEDWEKAIKMFDTVAPLVLLGDTQICLFVGHKVPLMPMAGSVKLFDLKSGKDGKQVMLIMVNLEQAGGTHFSIRSTGDGVHSGRIAGQLSDRLVSKFGQKGQISGGGHPRAAECKTRLSGVPFYLAIKEFVDLITQMATLAKKENLLPEEKDQAKLLGLDYLLR